MKPKYFDPEEIELAHQEIEFYNITNAFNEKKIRFKVLGSKRRDIILPFTP